MRLESLRQLSLGRNAMDDSIDKQRERGTKGEISNRAVKELKTRI